MAQRCFELENAFPSSDIMTHKILYQPQKLLNSVFNERSDTFFYFIPAEWGKDGERLRKCEGGMDGNWVWKKPKIPKFLPPKRIRFDN